MNQCKLFFFLLVFFFVSCKKEKVVQDVEEPRVSEFTTCNCTAEPGKVLPDEYIRGNIDGVDVCADIKGGFQDSFDNMLTYGTIKRSTGDSYYDNLYMIRYTKDRSFQFAIFLENTHLLTKQFPYELPRANPEFCEIGQFALVNQSKLTSNMCMYCPDNYWHYSGSFYGNEMKFTAEKLENGYLEGRFEGFVHTGSLKYVTVNNGKFKIRLTIIQRDIIVP